MVILLPVVDRDTNVRQVTEDVFPSFLWLLQTDYLPPHGAHYPQTVTAVSTLPAQPRPPLNQNVRFDASTENHYFKEFMETDCNLRVISESVWWQWECVVAVVGRGVEFLFKNPSKSGLESWHGFIHCIRPSHRGGQHQR